MREVDFDLDADIAAAARHYLGDGAEAFTAKIEQALRGGSAVGELRAGADDGRRPQPVTRLTRRPAARVLSKRRKGVAVSDGLSENWATLWEAFADAQPDQTAVVVGDVSQTWRELDDRATRLASALAERGAATGTRIAQLMYNCPEYLESSYAAFKLRATPVNVNYRYKAPEIAYICDNAGAEVLVFHGSLGPQVADAVASMPTVRVLLQVDDGTPLVEGAEWYHDVVERSEPAARIERSGEDTLMLYTGGTTGNPKGVVWRHVDLFGALAFTAYMSAGIEVPTTPEDVGRVAAELRARGQEPGHVVRAAADARDGAVPRDRGVRDGRQRGAARESFVRRRRAVGSRAATSGDTDLPRRRRVRPTAQRGTRRGRGRWGDPRPDVGDPDRVDRRDAVGGSERAFERRLPNAVIIDMIGASEGGPYAMSMTMPGTEPPEKRRGSPRRPTSSRSIR